MDVRDRLERMHAARYRGKGQRVVADVGADIEHDGIRQGLQQPQQQLQVLLFIEPLAGDLVADMVIAEDRDLLAEQVGTGTGVVHRAAAKMGVRAL